MGEQTFNRIKKTADFKEIHWPSVASVLVANLKLPECGASKTLRQFLEKLREPFEIHWFVNPIMSTEENACAAAICQTIGADSAVVQIKRTIRIAGLRFAYQADVEFEPSFRRGEASSGAGRARPVVSLGIGGWTWRLDHCDKVLFAGLSSSLAAGFAYAVLYGMVLYGVAVLSIFLVEPGEMTKIAVSKLHIGLALLGTLVGAAAIFGAAVKNIYRAAAAIILGKRNKSKNAPRDLDRAAA